MDLKAINDSGGELVEVVGSDFLFSGKIGSICSA